VRAQRQSAWHLSSRSRLSVVKYHFQSDQVLVYTCLLHHPAFFFLFFIDHKTHSAASSVKIACSTSQQISVAAGGRRTQSSRTAPCNVISANDRISRQPLFESRSFGSSPR
jgi:hypothetical protein